MISDKPIGIDLSKCIGCAMCVNDCPSNYLYISDMKAKTRKKGCIGCGHCYAICPQNAIIMNNYDTSSCTDIVDMTELDSNMFLQAMKSRRTIRQFTDEKVESQMIEKILDAGRYCPSSTNSQNVSYTILASKQDDIEKECVRIFNSVKNITSPFVKMVKDINIDENFFFKGAQTVIVVSSKSNINAGLASSYMELMAESMGLGVLYSGFFVACAKISPRIKNMLKLPKGGKVITCMVVGYPDVKYIRTVPRKEVQVKWL